MELTEYDPMRHHSIAYPMEVGAPKFDLVPVTKQKDIMVNAARMHAQQEYDRIMELVNVLQKQAEEIRIRLDITDQVHAAEYQFQVYPGKLYWLVRDAKTNKTLLSHNGPSDWCTGVPENYRYIVQIKWLGDYTWMEVPGTRLQAN
jgi:hypothetical protein